MSHNKIPLIPLAFSLTSVACTDPIIGDWDLTEMCQDSDCVQLPLEMYGYTSTVSMTIESDLSGTITQSVTYADEVDSNEDAITVTNEGGKSYKITSGGEEDALSCSLDATELECSLDGTTWTFEKQ